ncbi:bifunctional 3,4-dihydroxy-2-butanone-4-phosphate synthase/GTP cyclohydrolase II [Limnochorda sp.]|uniref:bifunctional 3,4-dihydroxy-2-butanone-4-phosphate synthase/GTP cyclohydrolase II n=1 Tax=Limnochorda sp. TaxID=1940279 RepID=UPI001DFC8243|nr:bifunctional 3,4-dihydroxy-2-butanone-4-phosphate synthase/GTP cyclohydrolase II [Bacillota bacterium]MBO2519161.1 bifunctional 3,4-dihydroxy-2-butanone-4-phosphate synthase/GTP cyclohydrolase II [Bacillota bacterium]
MDPKTALERVEKALEALRAGRMIIVVDDEDRENEGDLVMAAEKATPEAINFMTRYGRGLVCVPMTAERAAELQLPLMVDQGEESMGTAFTVSVDARGVRTGISAAERARTVQLLADPATRPEDLIRPGHIFPLKAKAGGVLRRAGHTEAAVDLMRLAGLQPVGVICEIMNPDGTMARRPELEVFAQEHGLVLLSVRDVIRYRMHHEQVVRPVAETRLPTEHGTFRLVGYEAIAPGEHHVALVKGEVDDGEPVLVRVHSECLTGEVFGSFRCDCGPQLEAALQHIEWEGRGVLIYMRQEGRGIGLLNKIRAYALQDQGLDTVEANHALGFPADLREYGISAQILKDLGVRSVRLMTNNPDKVRSLEGYGIEVVERVPLEIGANPSNRRYLETKRTKMGHWLEEALAERVTQG